VSFEASGITSLCDKKYDTGFKVLLLLLFFCNKSFEISIFNEELCCPSVFNKKGSLFKA